MNKLTIIGNLVRDPETRTVGAEHTVCSFTVAVNRRKREGHDQEADYFKVSAWDKLGDNCQKYLAKGKKCAVTGPVSVSSYESKDGSGTRFSLDVRAEEVEFLSSREQSDAAELPAKKPEADGFNEVDSGDLPF
jgi:single-strand DNA-binding protein